VNLVDTVMAEVPRALEDLERLVAIPSVSSLPEHADDVQRSAEAVRDLYRAEGVDARVVTTGGAMPAVLGHRAGPAGAPTVLLYAHHDVQPTGDLAAWSSDPFVPTRRDGRLLGRGTSDDKGAIALHLALLRAFGDDLPVSLVVLVEGEEEIGSPGFAALLEGHRDELRCDVVVVPDAVNPDRLTPSATTGLRGNADLVIELATLTRPVHSGLYGGVLPCALTSLVQLIGTLWDETGELVVDGLGRLADPPEALVELDGLLLAGVREAGDGSFGERLVGAPSLTVLALDAVPVAAASNVLHPRARAKLGLRVPPGEDAGAALAAVEAHLLARVPHGAQVSTVRGRDGSGFLSPSVPDVWSAAAEQAYGRPPVAVGVGGSIPFVTALAEAFPEAEVLITALQDPGSNAHSFDESLDLEGFGKACVAHALLLRGLAERR